MSMTHRGWSDLRVRTAILDLLDREQVALSSSEISQALHVPAPRVKAALEALVETREVYSQPKIVSGSSRRTGTHEYYSDYLTEVLA